MKKGEEVLKELESLLIQIISETNGISLSDTLELLGHSPILKNKPALGKLIHEFQRLLSGFQQDEVDVETLLGHPVSHAFGNFFKNFPLSFHEEHIHLTGSLTADFIWPRLKKLLDSPNGKIYEDKIKDVYGEKALPITCEADVDRLIRLKEGELFKTYLKILYLPKLILNSKQAHIDAAYHMAKELNEKYNVGMIRLKFTLSRANQMDNEQIPGLEDVTEEDVVLGLDEGFKKFQTECPSFRYVLSPSFRKELDFFDSLNFKSKGEHFNQQVDTIIALLNKHPHLRDVLNEIDTDGDVKDHY